MILPLFRTVLTIFRAVLTCFDPGELFVHENYNIMLIKFSTLLLQKIENNIVIDIIDNII